jgi:hypothetical protein
MNVGEIAMALTVRLYVVTGGTIKVEASAIQFLRDYIGFNAYELDCAALNIAVI